MKKISLFIVLTLVSSFATATSIPGKLISCTSGEELGPVHVVEYYSDGIVVVKKMNYEKGDYDIWPERGILTNDESSIHIQILREPLPNGNVGINPYSGEVFGKRAKTTDAKMVAYDAILSFEKIDRSASVYCIDMKTVRH